MMIVLICGSRDWQNVKLIHDHITRLSPGKVIHGGCRGADTIAGVIAHEMGIPVHVFEADWKSHGRGAGPIRNQKMLDEGRPDLVLAFHNNIDSSRGTSDMVKRAKRRGISCKIISEDFSRGDQKQ